jgi:uncharacterized SAM-binding protein YcdF (DUF218 family)
MYTIISILTQPYPFLFVATGLAVLNLWRRRRESRTRLMLVSVPLAMLWGLSLPAAGYLAIGSLEWRYPPLREVPAGADAIVVLSAGADPPDEVRPRAVLGAESLIRCLQAAEEYRRSKGLPVVASGGSFHPGTPGLTLAGLMKEFLVGLGVKDEDVIVEGRSRTTYENAVETGKILRARGYDTIVLVTDATHLPRAVRCFRKQGLIVIPSGCRYRATRPGPVLLWPFPSAAAVQGCLEAFHEWVGVLWYALNGRV